MPTFMAVVLFGIGPSFIAVVISWTNFISRCIPDDYFPPHFPQEMDLLRTFMGNLGLKDQYRVIFQLC